MDKNRVVANAVMTSAYVVVNACILFILYKFVLRTIGVERLGIWSLVLASISIGSVVQLGFSGSVVKFVAKYLALKGENAVVRVIQTAVISIALFIGAVLLILYPFARWFLNLLIDETSFPEAIAVLPYALLSVWLSLVGYVYQSALDGFQFIVYRRLVLILASLIQLLIVFVLVPAYGVLGLAYSQVVQTALILILGAGILKWLCPLMPLFPRRWDSRLFQEMLGYSLSMHVVSICEMILDPITKALMAKFGGLAMTGFYDLASRMMLQLRELIVQANAVLVPTVADLLERNRGTIEKIYRDSYALNCFFSIPFYALIVVSAPFISWLWLDYYEDSFITFCVILSAGWFVNTISTPASVMQLGIGELRGLLVGSLTMVGANVALGVALGLLYGGPLVVAAWSVSRIIASLIIIQSYHYENHIPLKDLFPRQNISLMVGSGIVLSGFFAIVSIMPYRDLNPAVFASAVGCLYVGTLGFPIWLHPVRRRLSAYLADEFIKRLKFQESK